MTTAHACPNCEGIDPDTCLTNPDRPRPAASPDDTAMQALSDAGAVCGTCGDQPGDRICPDCERCYRDYVTALRAAGWAPRSEVLNEAADVAESLRQFERVTGSRGAAQVSENVGVLRVADELRRRANEGACTGECSPTTGAFKHDPQCPNQPATAAS